MTMRVYNINTNYELRNDLITELYLGVPTIEEGRKIPVIYGRQWISGFYLQYGGGNTLYIDPVGVNTAWKYIVPFWMGLCYGPVTMLAIRYCSGGEYETITAPHQKPVYGDELRNNYNDGTGTYFPTGLVDNNNNALPYINRLPGIAHQYFTLSALAKMPRDINLSYGMEMHTFYFLMERQLSGALIPGPTLSTGSNPVHAIYDLLTNTRYGCCVPNTNIDLESFGVVAQHMVAKNYGINMTINDSLPARDYIDKICQTCGIVMWKDRCDKYKMRSYNPDDILHYEHSLSDSDFIDFNFSRKQFIDMPTEFQIKMLAADPHEETDPDKMGELKIYTIDNPALYNINDREKISVDIDLSLLCKSAAMKRSVEIINEYTYPAMSVNCTTNMQMANSEPMDVVMITNSEHGITNRPFRIMTIDLMETEENKTKLSLAESIEFAHVTTKNEISDYREEPGAGRNTDQVVVYFPAYSYTSAARVPAFTNPANAILSWGDNLENKGQLILNEDYTINANSQIILTAKWQSTVEANSLGLLNVQTYEAT